MQDPHYEGFEKEALFHDALGSCCSAHPRFKAKTLKEVMLTIYPEFMEGLFDVRPCARKLRYRHSDENPDANECNQFFIQGAIYESINFNGGTYAIKGYEGRIGCAYFEVCDD